MWEGPVKPFEHIINAAHYRVHELLKLSGTLWSKEAKWANDSQNIYHINATQQLMEGLTEFQFPTRNTNPFIFATPNAAIDLRDGKVHIPTRDEGFIMHSNVLYNPSATCPTWDRYLESSQPNQDTQEYIMRATGYTMTGSMKEQAFFYLLGVEESGKSTLMHVLRGLMGGYSADTNFSTFEEKYGNGIPNDLAPLRDKRLVIAGEPSKRSRWNDQVIKSITGEDPISARFLHKEFFTFNPQFKVWVMANWEIGTNDASGAFFRRTKVIKFENNFKGRKDRDPNLKAKLTAEMPGILNKAIEYAKIWYREGLKEPALVAAAIQEYKDSENINTKGAIGLYLDQCVQQDSSSGVTPTDFYIDYRRWTSSISMSDKEALSLAEFGRQLRIFGFVQDRDRQTMRRMYRVRFISRLKI